MLFPRYRANAIRVRGMRDRKDPRVDKDGPASTAAPKGVRARQAKDDARVADVLALAKQYESMGLNMPAKVAEDLQVSAKTVRQILDAAKQGGT